MRIRADCFDQLEDMSLDFLDERDIKDLAKLLARIPANGGRVIFGVTMMKRLIGMIHWVQSYERVYLTPTVVNGVIQEEMRQLCSEAFGRSNTRKAVAK